MPLTELSNIEISKTLRHCVRFNGVFGCLDLPKNPKHGSNIINISERDSKHPHGLGSLSGTHWVCAIIEPKCCYYIDPFGQVPNTYIMAWLNTSHNPTFFNNHDIQALNSSACGYYCMYMVLEYNKDRKVVDILDDFTKHTHANELLLQRYFNKH
jgi:hypothetical protein